MSPWLAMNSDHTRPEIVKCVVVGDTAVGKTRLICARACNAYLSLSQLLSTHIPTVWAIDQYRIHKEVLNRSWKVVDGVKVSLRLWDTFGDHEKDRKFAYLRSDVVLLCFSISNQQSLRNCKTKWFPEIRQNCPHTPIILVGCKNDLRHIYRDKKYLDLCREKSPFMKIVQESDLTTREQGRKLAEEIGASYYETSVLTQYGIEEVFVNAMRVALIARRQKRFWIKNLKNVQFPSLQKPYCPPRPPMPELEELESTYETDIKVLLDKGYYADVKLLAGKIEFSVHKYVLAAASPYFRQLFFSSTDATKSEEDTLTTFQRLSPSTVDSYLRFIYTGYLSIAYINVSELMEMAELTQVEELQIFLRNAESGDEYMNYEVQQMYLHNLQDNMKEVCLNKGIGADIVFELDDGSCAAHRSILMARSDFMKAMFGGNFKESSSKTVCLPEVKKVCFHQLLVYLYTDKLDTSLRISDCLPLLMLANKLCLLHLKTLTEKHAVFELTEMNKKKIDITEHVCSLLELCQVHNADQLSDWCQYFININFQDISLKSAKLLRCLQPENQACLNKNRWPPLSYLKELEYYERCVREKEQKEKPQSFLRLKRATKKVNGCFWFRRKNNACTEYVEETQVS